ncbi:MAG: CBS domain-containing protein [Nanoarchaeota archaeon]|nr:CBS domain-containing protein [Nanoarchaeota archaeon]
MSSPVVTTTPAATILEASKIMAKHRIGALIVVEDDMKLRGILTERDILVKVLAAEKEYNAMNVEDVMTTDVYTVGMDATLLDISKIMNKHGIRHAVVMEGEKVMGIVTARDLIELVSG